MKNSMFMLTRSEQRMVVLLVLALLLAAFIRYWRDAHSPYPPKPRPNEAPATALTPEASQLDLEQTDDKTAEEATALSSPASSP